MAVTSKNALTGGPPAPDSAPDTTGNPFVGVQEPAPAGKRSADDRLAELEQRVARLENRTGNRIAGVDARTEEERDAEILRRTPNSYPEAVRYAAAEERQRRREGKSETDPTSDKPITDPTSKG